MRHRIAKTTVSTMSMKPLSGIVQIDTAASTLQFELNEEIAHDLCMQLDRFLTQGQQLPKVRRAR
jgi:hypothetical protein